MQRLLVLEINELPKRIVDWWIEREPNSAFAHLVGAGSITETVLDERLPRDLYPSQSWASVNTGVPFERHGVFWYGDPKPKDFPLYWQVAADAGRSVGLMGVLHSSPRSVQASGPSYRFVMPDLFGDDASTVPTSLGPIQELNLKLTRQSARVASLRLHPSDAVAAASLVRRGVRPATLRELSVMAAQVARGAWNKERLRVGQSMLLADVFVKQVRSHDPDLSMIFLNHLAAFMHRYWAATFPDDWTEGSGYSSEWVERHAEELPYAMRGLDRIVGQMSALASETGRTLVIVSSMGMKADTTVDAQSRFQAVVRNPEKFLAAAGLSPALEIRSAMVPQFTVVADSADEATHVESRLRALLGQGMNDTMVALEGDRHVMTLSYAPPTEHNAVFVGDAWVEPSSVGMTIEAIDDHRSGRHSPRGVLVSDRQESWPTEISAFDVAPMMLDRLGVDALPHHRRLTTA